MTMRSRTLRIGVLGAALAGGLAVLAQGDVGQRLLAQARKPEAVKSLRMYVFELGNIPVDLGNLFEPPIKVAKGGCCIIVAHLLVHPRGTLVWDTGVVPDDLIGTDKAGPSGKFYSGKPFRAKLAEVGYRPEDITYIAFSHYHFDHTANGNLFRNSTWIVQQAERAAMIDQMEGRKVPGGALPEPSHYNELMKGKTIALANMDEYDVFGDGSVVVMAAHGHTAGHQVLVVNLPRTGRVMLSGDLYHFREEREQQVLPATLEHDKEKSRQSRVKLEAWAKKHNVPIWIEHDNRLYDTLKKAPAYVE
jgi:glyoxylase-like metal-dependent hydrolase (beta-lactamase superfamily II)